MRSSLAVLALVGVVTQSEVAQAVQKKHHHHHHKHSLAQEPKEEEKTDSAAANPDSNRSTFDAAVKTAAKVVATQNKTENTNVTNVADANTKATEESNKLFTDVTKARVQQTHGEVNHRQWVNKNATGNWAQTSNPDGSRTSYETHVTEAEKVVATQKAQEKANVTAITNIHSTAAGKTKALKNKVTEARVSQIAGEVPYSRNSRGWQLVPPGTGHALAQNEATEATKTEKKEAAKEAPKALAQGDEPAKEEAKAPAVEEAKAPAKEEAKAEAAPAKEEAKADAAPAEAAPAKAEGGDAKAAEGDAKVEAGAESKAPDASDAKAPAKAAAPAEEKKVVRGTPEVSYSAKAASLQAVLDTVAEQRRFENQSNADVAAAQEKYYKQSENEKNTVRAARKIQRDGGLVHDTPMPIKYKLAGFAGKASLAQAEPMEKAAAAEPVAAAAPAKAAEPAAAAEPSAPVEEEKEGEQEPPKQNPENAYKQKAASRQEVEKVVADQQQWEATSNKDVTTAQEKYWDQAENQKNDVRIDRRIQANGGVDHREGYQRWPASSFMQRETPDESRKIFEDHVKQAADIVKTENSQENTRTTQIAKMDKQNVKDTFDEKARVRSGRVAMMRGGPRQRYSGGHNGPVAQEEKAAALAQESGSDASSESDSDEEEINAKQHQALQQAIAKKQNKQQAREESSDSSSDSDSD